MSVKLSAALGFCAKAGKIKSGDFAAERAVKQRNAKGILLDTSASDNTRQKWGNTCSYADLPLVIITDVGKKVGKPDKIVFAVTDEGFMQLIQKALDEE